MDIISVSNQKGGVSKTGVSFNLGTALAMKHSQKVLLIDLDPQANLSEYLKYEPDGKPTLTQLVMTACTGGRLTPEFVSSAIRHNDTAGVDYIPSDINLANSETLMQTALSRETMLSKFKSSNDIFVVSDKLKPVEPRTMQYRFSNILKNADLPSFHYHSLRHLFATRCIELGFDVKNLSEILGHSSVEVTIPIPNSNTKPIAVPTDKSTYYCQSDYSKCFISISFVSSDVRQV